MIRLRHPTLFIENYYTSLERFINDPFIAPFTKYPSFIEFAIDPNGFVFASYSHVDVLVGVIIEVREHYESIFRTVDFTEIRVDKNDVLYNEVMKYHNTDQLMNEFNTLAQKLIQRQLTNNPVTANQLTALLNEVSSLCELHL